MEKGRRRKNENKNKKNNFTFWTLVLSFLFLCFLYHCSLRDWCLFSLIKCGQGLIIWILLSSWTSTRLGSWHTDDGKKRDVEKAGRWATICAGFVPETADSADSMRDPQGMEGFMGQLQPNPISFFFTKHWQAGRLCCKWQESLSRKEGRKEGRKEMSDVHCTCVCLFVALVFSLLPLY